ncbi:glycosyltransferase [Segetibacter aerophilus]|uniref:Glycosyl transferase n=1 Tax=Segetibacter aerophilus TaxID=670293 RepID=A0A512BI52_9BACT|nr:glycosyltransferase [Segetibacter aerophilus]GEO11630.1 glycosyl transferase [Segetibacter aerophilus]
MENKRRLLIILNRFVIGGQAVDTIPLVWNLRNDFEILILFGEKEKDELEPVFLLDKYPGLQLKKISYLRRSINPLIDIWAFFSVLYAIVKFRANIVHTHGAKSGFIGRISAWLAGVPVIIHTFHGHFFHSYFSPTISTLIAQVERLIGKVTTCAIALSDAQKEELASKYKILPLAKIKIIPLGFAFDQVNEPSILRNTFRNKYALHPDDVAVGIVGRIVAVKNHFFFNKIVQNLLTTPTANPAAFFIIGDGDLKTQVEKDLQQKGLPFSTRSITKEKRVVFTSWLTEMYEVMNGLDIVVLTSLNEGTPLSIIEAQYFKRPVVCTNVGGVKDTMIDSKTGFLSESNDETTFSKKLRLLIENKELRFQMGDEGYKFVSARFSKQKEVEMTRALYQGLLKEKGKG